MWQIHEGAWPSDAGGKASAATPPGVRIHPDAGRRHRPDPTILPLCSLTHQTGASRSTPRPADVVAQSMPRHQPAGRVPICTRVHRSAHPSVSGRARYTGRGPSRHRGRHQPERSYECPRPASDPAVARRAKRAGTAKGRRRLAGRPVEPDGQLMFKAASVGVHPAGSTEKSPAP